MTEHSPTRRDLQREATRRKVFEAALAIFRRDGVAGARIEDIAKAAGVSRGTFYFHFPTKKDVLVQVLRESEVALVRHIDALPPDAPILAVMEATARGVADQWQEDAPLLPDIGVVALQQTTLQADVNPQSHLVQAALELRFLRATDQGELRGEFPPELLTRLFLVSLFGAVLAWTGSRMLPLQNLLEAVNTFFLRAASKAP